MTVKKTWFATAASTLSFALALPAMAALSVATVHVSANDGRGDGAASKLAFTAALVLPTADPVAANINDAMYIALFHTLAPPQAGKTHDVGAADGTASLEFTVTRNDRIFAITYSAEGCGAYCESYQQVFAFDARTGRRLTAAQLLTGAGRHEVVQRVRKQKIAAYAEQLRINKSALRDEQGKKPGQRADKETLDDLQARMTLDADCLAQAEAPASDDAFAGLRLNPGKTALELTASRCSNHADHALDDVDEVSVKLPYADIKPYLTPYGRAVLLGEGEGKPGGVSGQVLRGTIGASPVTMLLDEEGDGSIGGTYFYNRQRKALHLRGRRRGNTIELEEFVGEADKPNARLVLAVDGLQVKGRWRDARSDKGLDVSVVAP